MGVYTLKCQRVQVDLYNSPLLHKARAQAEVGWMTSWSLNTGGWRQAQRSAAPLQCEHRHLLHLCLISLPEPLSHPLKIIHASQTHLTNILFKLNECSNDFLRFKKEKSPLFHLEINGLHRPADTDVFKWANIDGWLPVPMQPKRNRWQVRISFLPLVAKGKKKRKKKKTCLSILLNLDFDWVFEKRKQSGES